MVSVIINGMSMINVWLQSWLGSDWVRPTVILALIGIIASSGTSIWVNWKKITADILLAEKKFNFDSELSKQKFEFEKAQIIHKRRFELAETLLVEACDFRELIAFVRFPGGYGGERKSDPNGDIGGRGNSSPKNAYYVPIERLEGEKKFTSAFLSKRYTAQAHFGDEALEAFKIFRKVTDEITSASQMLIIMADYIQPPDEKNRQKLEAIIWAGMADALGFEDKIQIGIDKGVAIIEKLCKEPLQWKGA